MILGLLLSGLFTLVELNCENLFDYKHDVGKQDTEYLPESKRNWTPQRYWRKLNLIAQELLSCSDEGIPDLVALCEIENDSVMYDMSKRSLLRNAGYEYLMTSSPDERGIDVALLYSPFSFTPLNSRSIRVNPIEGMRPTRDILYVSGKTVYGDTLHVLVVHQPSKFGGEKYSEPFRKVVADKVCETVDSIMAVSPGARLIVAGDFNDGPESLCLQQYEHHGLYNFTKEACADNGVEGTYRYKGEWDRIDHILGSASLSNHIDTAFIHAPRFLLEEDPKFGGYRPRRTYNGMRYQQGYSDHLPLIVRFIF